MIYSLCPDNDHVDFVSSRCGEDDSYSIEVPCKVPDLVIHLVIQAANVLDCVGRRTKSHEGYWRWQISRDDLSAENVAYLCCRIPFDSEASSWNLTRDVVAKILFLRNARCKETADQIAAEVCRSYHSNVSRWGKFHEQC